MTTTANFLELETLHGVCNEVVSAKWNESMLHYKQRVRDNRLEGVQYENFGNRQVAGFSLPSLSLLRQMKMCKLSGRKRYQIRELQQARLDAAQDNGPSCLSIDVSRPVVKNTLCSSGSLPRSARILNAGYQGRHGTRVSGEQRKQNVRCPSL